jgi:trehalose 6-phosphate synthase
VLWPILHYRLDLAEYKLRDLTGYLRVNKHFADELHKIVEPDDVIWVHDYHLIPLAKTLRERGHKNKIGFFLHTPLPPMEILAALPSHEKLFPALCHYDLVGFQTETDAANFARYLAGECKLPSRDMRTFLANGRSVHIGVFPVGIAIDEIQRWAEAGMESNLVRRVVHSLENRTMLIGVDRLDYSKGIVPRIEAFERFLFENPEWRGRIAFLQIAPRSRVKVREYIEIEELVTAAVGRVNGSFGQADWTPIRYINQSYSRSALAALYRCARAGLVTPLRDGMNLVAKEYIASQNPDDPGVLILSRFAGAAKECTGAILINPYDTDSTAQAIAQALSMPLEERRAPLSGVHGEPEAERHRRLGQKPTGLSGICGGIGKGSATISAACGPAAANANRCAVRRTPDCRQKRSATAPRSGAARVVIGSNGSSALVHQDGMTSVPAGPSASRNAAMRPRGPPSTGRTARNEVWTSNTPPGFTPSARNCAATWARGISDLVRPCSFMVGSIARRQPRTDNRLRHHCRATKARAVATMARAAPR